MPIPISSTDFDTVTPIPVTAWTVDNIIISSRECEQFSSLSLYFNLDLDTLTHMFVRVEFSKDETTWYRMTDPAAVAANVSVLSVYDWRMNADGLYRIVIDTVDAYYRVSVQGVGGAGSSSLDFVSNLSPR